MTPPSGAGAGTHYDPSVYLAIDNCFAKKRWALPEEWAPIIAGLGIRHVELSADTEADPMYHGAAYLRRWDEQVEAECRRNGIEVASLYSGHGSYSTLGLLHPDQDVVDRLVESWVKPAISRAAEFGASMGFFFHAIREVDLHDAERYAQTMERLRTVLVDIARHAGQAGGVPVGIEQMYTPNQPPWTISGTRELLTRVSRQAAAPLYTTLDTGHAGAQREYLPGHAGHTGQLHLTAETRDADTYAWMENLGCYSPIVHLQQTDGTRSAHSPFTATENSRGIITPARVLRSLWASYSTGTNTAPGVVARELPPVKRLNLTLEIFGGTATRSVDLLAELRESVAWWRTWIPDDGMRLSEIVDRMPADA